jgi:hypothetical protein
VDGSGAPNTHFYVTLLIETVYVFLYYQIQNKIIRESCKFRLKSRCICFEYDKKYSYYIFYKSLYEQYNETEQKV